MMMNDEERGVVYLLKNDKQRIEDEIAQISQAISEHESVIELMDDLPKKLRHSVMVPMGSQAFMPGYLVHTNEVLMQLGSDMFVSRTTAACKPSLQKRVTLARQAKENLLNSLKNLDLKLDAISSPSIPRRTTKTEAAAKANVHKMPDGTVEIVEWYESDEEAEQKGAKESKEAAAALMKSPEQQKVAEQQEEAPVMRISQQSIRPSVAEAAAASAVEPTAAAAAAASSGGGNQVTPTTMDRNVEASDSRTRLSKFKQDQLKRRQG